MGHCTAIEMETSTVLRALRGDGMMLGGIVQDPYYDADPNFYCKAFRDPYHTYEHAQGGEGQLQSGYYYPFSQGLPLKVHKHTEIRGTTKPTAGIKGIANKNVSVKLEKKKWEEIVVKRQKEADENVTPDIDENGFDNLATSMGRDQERVKDRLLKNTYSKKSKRVSLSSVSAG
ncbi:autism susceptibility gene 2-like protein [Labeo rohita]|uniref:Autism susceptibility gene 2-like protein n=1 Tax=Labeo rohita TaxID=84645 RepID=A0A498NG66_LABRO|nr:autism susceptibility gene 2-like protein [Labeo rohita]